MRLKTSIRAGARGCSPEAQYYMEKAYALENKLAKCLANQGGVIPPYNGYDPIYYPPTNIPAAPSVVGAYYPDRSGWCG